MTTPNEVKALCEKLRTEADNLEADFEPGHPNAEIYARQVAQLRADAALIESPPRCGQAQRGLAPPHALKGGHL